MVRVLVKRLTGTAETLAFSRVPAYGEIVLLGEQNAKGHFAYDTPYIVRSVEHRPVRTVPSSEPLAAILVERA